MSAVAPFGAQVAASVLETVNGEPRVSSLMISERTGTQHKNVLELIRTNTPALEQFGDLAFQTRDRPGVPGPALQVALLNEPQSTLLMTFMRNSDAVVGFKLELVKQFYAMKQALTSPALPATYAGALRELAATVEQTAALEAKIQIDSPKVSYVDQFVADEDLLLLRTVAKTIGIPEGELREALIARGWIYEETSTRWSEKQQDLVKMVRYSAYSQKRAYFRPVLRHDAPRFKGEVMHTLKVTPQGAEAIARNFKKEDAE
ncbi:Rha family transcriptional regulator [Mycetocola saprophilus]|uniref:Rha family transcriptional regulator n=1 Tax=Mycetocola saprophilus TaxID=76636 RepID=UPI000690EF35|nr:phage regulatory protein/antirepressor Ant [Mycetocola saprophilus]